jgi:beta-lactamase superfamily II metal-dependent hydrolase
MRLYFLNVGQGDAVLVVSPEGKSMLYDGGRKSGGAVGEMRALGVKHLDLVVSSHGDADHIAAQSDAIAAFGAGAYMDNTLDKGTRTQAAVLEAARDAKAQLLKPTRRKIALGSVSLEVVPPPLTDDDANDNSVGIAVNFGPFRAFMSGDSETPETRSWLKTFGQDGPWANTDVYKSIHHGSRNGDNATWLAAVRPKLAVVSVGAKNSFGHPNKEVLDLYRKLDLPYLRTDRDGTVSVTVQPDGRYTVSSESGRRFEGRAGEAPRSP